MPLRIHLHTDELQAKPPLTGALKCHLWVQYKGCLQSSGYHNSQISVAHLLRPIDRTLTTISIVNFKLFCTIMNQRTRENKQHFVP